MVVESIDGSIFCLHCVLMFLFVEKDIHCEFFTHQSFVGVLSAASDFSIFVHIVVLRVDGCKADG